MGDVKSNKEIQWMLDGVNAPDENTHACWSWNRATEDGYGYVISRRDITNQAHTYMYVLCGNFLPEGMFVYHTCKNKLCINPLHLSVGNWEDTQGY